MLRIFKLISGIISSCQNSKIVSTSDSVSLSKQYEFALQLYTMEIKALGDRNSSFLVTQSILIVAFIQVILNRGALPYIFEILSLAIGITGILFCYTYYEAGLSGAKSAFKIRQFMQNLEYINDFKILTKIYNQSNHNHKKFDWKCDQCYYERLPLPHSWLSNTTIFSIAWCVCLIYTCISALIKFNPVLFENENIFSYFVRFDEYAKYIVNNICNIGDSDIFVKFILVSAYFIVTVLFFYTIIVLLKRIAKWKRNTLYS